MIENMEKMIAGSLGLEEPWYIEKAEFHEEEPAIHICGNQKRGTVFMSKMWQYDSEIWI